MSSKLVIEKFAAWLLVSKSGKTASYYVSVVKNFLNWVGKDVSEVTVDDVIKYLSSFKNKASATTYASVLKTFFRKVGREDLAKEIPSPKYSRKLPKWVEESKILGGVNNLLTEFELSGNLTALRNACLILLAYECALRLSEIVSLNESDFNTSECSIKITRVKSGSGAVREHVLPLSERTCDLLKKYVSLRKSLDGSLFVSKFGTRLSHEAVRQIAKSFFKRIGYSQYSTHTLRHSRLTNLAIKGADLLDLVFIAHHENPKNTMIYLHMSPQHIKQRLQKIKAI